MARLIWTDRALNDLEEILKRIEKDNPQAALSFAESLFLRVNQLSAFPKSGSSCPEDKSGTYREIVQGKYRVIYRCEDEHDVVYLVAVHQGARERDQGEFEN